MSLRRISVALIWLAATSAFASDTAPYLGSWSNGRGETLLVTNDTIQFADNRPVSYRDITRATDGASFELQITTPGEINAFPGKTLAVVCEDDSMQMTGYASHADYMQEGEVQFSVTWEKDDASPDDEDGSAADD